MPLRYGFCKLNILDHPHYGRWLHKLMMGSINDPKSMGSCAPLSLGYDVRVTSCRLRPIRRDPGDIFPRSGSTSWTPQGPSTGDGPHFRTRAWHDSPFYRHGSGSPGRVARLFRDGRRRHSRHKPKASGSLRFLQKIRPHRQAHRLRSCHSGGLRDAPPNPPAKSSSATTLG